MPEAVIDERVLIRRRDEAQSQIEGRRLEQRRLALAAERGDQGARQEFNRLEAEIAELQQQAATALVAVQGLQEEQAEQRRLDAEKVRKERLDKYRQLRARDQELQHARAQVFGHAEKLIGELVDALNQARAVGAERDQVDGELSTVEAALGRPRSVGLNFAPPRQVQDALAIRDRLCVRLNQAAPGLNLPYAPLGVNPLAVEVLPGTEEKPS